ncbi:MAG: hypothetical protein Q7U13_08195 [Rhodoferax sp.]|nr:hypothetical protein [Rhodoferax sp.]
MSTVGQAISNWCKAAALVFVSGFALVGPGCAVGPRLVNHSFAFDARADSPDAQVLDYRYGNTKQTGARASERELREGRVSQYTGTTGEMIPGDSLYVKWRIRSTGEVLEETVDLKSRLTRDITDHTVYFVIDGRELHVYLVSPELRPKDSLPFGPKFYRDYYKVYEIYPTFTLRK